MPGEEILVSVVFSMIGAGLQYLRNAGIPEETIDANWGTTKAEFYKRPSEDLPEVPE